MRKALITLLFIPGSALGYECLYTTECFEAEACQDTAFEMSVVPSDDYASATVTSVNGEFKATAYNFQGMSSYAGFTSSTLHLISISGRGASRYSVQTGDENGVTVITYQGACK